MELSLERFRTAQAVSYETALEEIRAGRKQSHWIWYIFPQLQGLGHSNMAVYYAIQDAKEAREYWQDPLLRGHLMEITQALLQLEPPVGRIMGYPDDLKLCSCMTLFYLVTKEPLFKAVLDKFYEGRLDAFTVSALSGSKE